MKVKNVVFSGFMAAILSATGANAAISVASKAYVDKFVGENGSVTTELSGLKQTVTDNKTATDEALDLKANTADVEATYATKTFVGSLEGKNAATIVEYIENKTADIASGSAFSTLTGRVDSAEGKITALEALTGTDGKIAQDIAKALTDAEGYADGKAADAQAAAEATAKGYTDDTVAGLDVATVGATGSYVKTVAQVNGQLEAQAEAFQTSIKKIDESNPETSLVAPTAKAVYDFVDTELGILNVGMTGVEGDIAALQAQLAEGGATKVAIDAAQAAAEAAQTTANGAVTVNSQQQTAIEKNASDIAANKTAAETGIQEAKEAAAAASTAAGTALTDAKKYADDQDVAQTATIKAAYELADTNLKSDLEDYADAQAKAVADTLKYLATAEVPEKCLTGEDGSNMCVLTLTSAGTFAWTPLTTPVE